MASAVPALYKVAEVVIEALFSSVIIGEQNLKATVHKEFRFTSSQCDRRGIARLSVYVMYQKNMQFRFSTSIQNGLFHRPLAPALA